MATGLVRSALALSVMGWAGAATISDTAAQAAPAEVGYVAALNGRVVMLSGGTPVLLDPLDVIHDRTRLDLQAGSELRICHYRTEQLLLLKGPLRASVTADGARAENGRPLDLSAIPCASPRLSKHQGGLVARGVLTGAR
jgi:hypothetical protein